MHNFILHKYLNDHHHFRIPFARRTVGQALCFLSKTPYYNIIFALESELAKSATKLPDPRVKYAVGEAKMPQRVKDAKTHARTFGSVGYIHAYNVMVRGERLPAPTSMILPGYIFYGPPQQFKVGPRAHSSAQ